MKIAVWHNLPSGGGKRALFDQVRGLSARRHSLTSFCPPSADRGFLDLGQLIDEHVVPGAKLPDAPGSTIGKLLYPYREVAAGIRAMDEHCQRCAEEINRGGFDLLFANACKDFAVPPIARYVRIPTVLYLPEPCRRLYEAMPRLPWVGLEAPPRSRSRWQRIQRFVADYARTQGLRLQAREELCSAEAFDRILVNSRFSRESLLRCYGLAADLCYLGVDTQRFVHRGLQRDGFVVGLGSIVPHKGVKFVIEALSRVASPRPELVWIGNDAHPGYLDEVTRFARSVDVEFRPRVRVDDEVVVDTLNRARMMVYAPILEPFGLAPLEANACGAPVIAVQEGGVRETILDGVNGICVERDPEEMAAAIHRLMSDPADASRLGENGVRLVSERWSLEVAIQRLEAKLFQTRDNGPGTLLQHDGRDVAMRLADGREFAIVQDAVHGCVDKVERCGSQWQFVGWAVDVGESRPASQVLVCLNGTSIASGVPDVSRPDIADFFSNDGVARAGFSLRLSLGDREERDPATEIRVFAISRGGLMSELPYPRSYRWRKPDSN